ncbi:flagellin N-terminal helical domain-containing protein [Devosia aurantiaca]|uniref:Flagellin n=1 Tax=Devosia aurantiaca TaxID=2714858 RepID=A0A6M1SRZ1_9HYPH|nr:flagellin [Devosia aurantiaca]NGP17965.1 hypothetical protein [Devosia aurantiaca]
MVDINLSKAVRSNLSSLQNTASLMAKTSDRLSTGNKVNTALDNPTNFFTASSLNSRAGDLNQLMDSMANGIKTIEAANNGLTAITKNLESMQSTLRQARQDKSFQTQSYTIDSTAIGTTALKNLSFSGGAVGATPVNIALNSLAGSGAATALTGTGANLTNFAGGNLQVNGQTVALTGNSTLQATTLDGAGASFTNFAGGTLSINGSANITIPASQNAVASTLDGSGAVATIDNTNDGDITIDLGGTFNSGNPFTVTVANGDDADAVALAINTAFTNAGGTGTLATNNGGTLELSSASGNGITVADAAGNVSGTAAALGFGAGNTASVDGSPAVVVSAASIKTQIDALSITGLTVGTTGGQLQLSLASGADITLTGTAAASAFGTTPLTSTNGSPAYTATAATIAAEINASNAGAGLTGVTADGTSGQLVFNSAGGSAISVTGGALATSLGFAAGNLSVASTGTAAAVKTVDQLVSDINASNDLKGKIRASNDNGKLRIENLSTQKLELAGIGDGKLNGSNSTGDIAGNSVRSDLSKQFNDLRDTLDKLADDASFNGINLLRGDNLKITFNETGTSAIDIQSKGARAINSSNLEIATSLTAKDLDTDEGIDAFIEQIKGALNSVRSQASAFGSNLSIVQNRQDFTKSMINTLETGAGNLTLADMNQEAANMMALQTRQSLASSTLSMANQADQSVLQLLR